MAISILLKINGTDFTGQILTPFELQRNKLWAGAGRVMSGKMSATLVGIFPKLVVEFAPENEVKLSALMTELDKAEQTLIYYDPKTRTQKTLGTYSADYTVLINSLQPKFGVVKATFVALAKE